MDCGVRVPHRNHQKAQNKVASEILGGGSEQDVQKIRTKAEYNHVERQVTEENKATESDNIVKKEVNDNRGKGSGIAEISQEQTNQQTIPGRTPGLHLLISNQQTTHHR